MLTSKDPYRQGDPWWRRFWINHPAASNPVGPWRYARWRFGEWMEYRGRRMASIAIHQDDTDEIPF